MRPSRENVFALLARLEQSGSLPADGPVSIFVTDTIGATRTHASQIVVRVSGDNVFARISRLPFSRPMVFSRQALRAADV